MFVDLMGHYKVVELDLYLRLSNAWESFLAIFTCATFLEQAMEGRNLL